MLGETDGGVFFLLVALFGLTVAILMLLSGRQMWADRQWRRKRPWAPEDDGTLAESEEAD